MIFKHLKGKKNDSEQIHEIIPDNTEETISEAVSPGEATGVAVTDNSELEELRHEVDRLNGELKIRSELTARMESEIGDFTALFPQRKLSEIPDSVWNDVRAGIPLSAAYSLYEKRTSAEADRAGEINRRNGELSSGPVGGVMRQEYYSPSEVRKMTRDEVRANYSQIIESMKKWN